MDEALQEVIRNFETSLSQKVKEANELKTTINMLYKQAGQAPKYTIEGVEDSGGLMSIAGNAFRDKPLATSFKEYLNLKGSAAGLDEIYEGLKRGGYELSGKNEGIKKRNLKIALIKNPDIDYIKTNKTFWFKAEGRKKGEKAAQEKALKEKPEDQSKDKVKGNKAVDLEKGLEK